MKTPQPHIHAAAAPMLRTAGLQPIIGAKAHSQKMMTSAELYAMHEKARKQPIRLDIAGPTRITNAAMPVCTEPAYPYPPHMTDGRLKANSLPSRMFDQRRYLDGRVEDLDGNVIQEAAR